MSVPGPAVLTFPVGFERFHRRPFLNYQFNRSHALGFSDRDELMAAASRIGRAEECPDVFGALAASAAAEGRTLNAAGYQRLAEFFTAPGSPAKIESYRRFRGHFDSAVSGEVALQRHQVPYRDASLPAYRLAAAGADVRGTVLVHGGFDSLIEEFFGIWQRLAAAGFEVIAYEGPGQGGARTLEGLTFDHDWEKPVGAVLDHFGLPSAALVGISMGGYWALRAAGREPRVDRVVAWPPVYDWMWRVPAPLRRPTRAMLRHEGFMRWSVRTRARLVPTLRQVVDQTLYLTGSDDPYAVVEWFAGMNADHLGSGRVTQDVLLLAGEHDSFQPPSLTRAQATALTAARSVTVRVFTEAEHADQHCQMGNLDLACGVLVDWLQS